MNAPEIRFPNLGIEIEHLSNVALNIFTLPLYWYGVIIALGVIGGYFAGTGVARREGAKIEPYTDFLFYALIFSIIGARLYYVVFSWDTYKNDLLSIFAFREGGLAIYGGIIGAIVTAVVYTRIKKMHFLRFADLGIVGLPMGQAIGRWGNFFNREVFGGYTNNLFAMAYRLDTVSPENVTPDIRANLVEYMGSQYIQVHPTFLYESLWNFGIVLFIVLYSKHRKFDGENLCWYLFLYGIGRFWIEGIRTDQLPLFGTGLAVSQVLSGILVLVTGVIIVYKRFIKPGKLAEVSQ